MGERLAFERRWRLWAGGLAIAGGILYELSQALLTVMFKDAPTVGIVQGLGPALHGVAHPAVSPAAEEVRFASHHAVQLIGGSVIAALGIGAAAAALAFLAGAVRHRRPESLRATTGLLAVGGAGFALVGIAQEVVSALESHRFATGHDFGNAAAVHALFTNGAILATKYAGLIVAIAFGVGVVVVSMNAMRVGLFPRSLGIVGSVAGVIFVLLPPLGIVAALWLVGTGVLLIGRWPSGDPPAWASGEARPWPTPAEVREAREAQRGGARQPRTRGALAQVLAGAGGVPGAGSGGNGAVDGAGEGAPEPALPTRRPRQGKRKRRR